MNREQYLEYRKRNAPEIMYEYYKEKYKGSDPFDMETLFDLLRMWPHANEAFGRVLGEYDRRFEIMAIQDLKTGKTIKYL